MTANVSILVADHNDVLKVPNVALRYTPPEDVNYEQIISTNLNRNQRMIYSPGSDGEKLNPIIVEIGITDGVDTEILSGSAEGTAIVTSTTKSGSGNSQK
jgi:HlyD family secretion protein